MATPPHPEAFVRWLRQVAPYVHAFRGRTFVVAFGGEMFAERARFLSFVHDLNLLAALGIRLVLVHGARPQVEAELKARGVRSRYAQGLRVTDEAALTAVKQAAGVLRIEIEAVLPQGLPRSPMAGAQIRVNSGNFITARPIGVRKGVDFLYTGAVRKVDAFAIRGALDAGELVLVAHVGYSPTGEVFNLSWEDVAENVAVALRADKLLMFTDRLPLDRKEQVISELTAHDAEGLARKGALTAQTSRALEHAVRALAGGVGRAHLVSRRVPGSLLLELFTHDGVIRGCAALYPFADDKSAEFACLAVAPEYRDAGYGERLLLACQERAKALKLRKLFALTTHAAHWFIEQGFKPADVNALPARRQELYNWRRGSKVFIKRI